MPMILMIAAGILLAFLLLPFLGPIIMIAASIGVIVFIVYGIMYIIAFTSAAADVVKDVKKTEPKPREPSFKEKVVGTKEYKQGTASIDELFDLDGMTKGPKSQLYAHVIRARFNNVKESNSFRIDEAPNRKELERYLEKSLSLFKDEQNRLKAKTLTEEILSCYDKLVPLYQKKSK